MAKPGKFSKAAREEPQRSKLAATAAAATRAPGGELLKQARRALGRGDLRSARALARKIVSTGLEADKPEAVAMIERMRPDRQSMLVAAAVLAMIWIAIWAGLLRR